MRSLGEASCREVGSEALDPRAALENIRRRDAIKNAWAAENGWRMVRIRFDEDVEERLSQYDVVGVGWRIDGGTRRCSVGGRRRVSVSLRTGRPSRQFRPHRAFKVSSW